MVGVMLVHPYFSTGIDQMWLYMCPTCGGLSDQRLKPAEEDLVRLRCEKALAFVAGKDRLGEVGIGYREELRKSGWRGSAELVESVGEEQKAGELRDKFASFIKHN
ncbi:hypothetical protein ACJRO7_034753 [Eucalyptus globulus]|uniref:Uncharacterized protein n=1 Tax=Eucalyptus globulus TaxID=34317 RepID=A0ABD3J4G4_EUCGL